MTNEEIDHIKHVNECNKGARTHEIIAVKGLTTPFGSITAVNNISFYVAEGEIFGFLDPNEAGKTTTIRMLTGLLTSDAGYILISGVDIRSTRSQQKCTWG